MTKSPMKTMNADLHILEKNGEAEKRINDDGEWEWRLTPLGIAVAKANVIKTFKE